MGCDIHAYVECRRHTDRENDGWWLFASIPFVPRNYRLFGALTNGEVRGEPMPDGPILRGIPGDLSWEAKDEWLEGDRPCADWHSPSWLVTEELLRGLAWADEDDVWWTAIIAAMEKLDAGGMPTRLVFWFDN